MSTIVNAAVGVLVLIVMTWVIIFGGIGAVLSRSRAGSAATGLAWGALLGPIGWIVIWVRTRGGGRPVTAGEWVGDTLPPGGREPLSPAATEPLPEAHSVPREGGGHVF
jgi:hypothetical protein